MFLDAFIAAVKNDFYNLKYQSYKQNPHKIITAEEAKALTHVKNNENIIIKKADKGAEVVVMSRDDYMTEGIRQLSDANFYVKLDYDPTPNHIDEIHNTLLKALTKRWDHKKDLRVSRSYRLYHAGLVFSIENTYGKTNRETHSKWQ